MCVHKIKFQEGVKTVGIFTWLLICIITFPSKMIKLINISTNTHCSTTPSLFQVALPALMLQIKPSFEILHKSITDATKTQSDQLRLYATSDLAIGCNPWELLTRFRRTYGRRLRAQNGVG